MAPHQPLQVNYGRAFYLSMLTLGFVALTTMFYLFLTDSPQNAPAAPGDPAQPDPEILWVAAAAMLFCMGYYMLRALRRLVDPGPVIEVRPEGILLRIGEPRRYLWNEIQLVTLGRQRMRARLEIQVTPDRFVELRLPTLFADDNFVGIRNRPFTIGITGQGLDRPLSDVFDEVRRLRPNLAKR